MNTSNQKPKQDDSGRKIRPYDRMLPEITKSVLSTSPMIEVVKGSL